MSDITMCNGGGCPNKEKCYRFTATPNPWRQSYFMAPPYLSGIEDECQSFWDNTDREASNERSKA